MGVRLSEDEAWEYLRISHTGIITTLRRDGVPIPLPVWYVTDGRSIVFSTPSRSKKVTRIRNDPRGTFLVEGGLRWSELVAVTVIGSCQIVQADDELDRVRAALDEKYRDFRTQTTAMPTATKQHYAGSTTVVRLVPTERLLTWDNKKLRLGQGQP